MSVFDVSFNCRFFESVFNQTHIEHLNSVLLGTKKQLFHSF